MTKLKVLQIGKYYPPYKGGFETSLFTLVESLKDRLQIDVLVSNTNSKTVIERDNGLSIIRLANFGKIFSQPITPTLAFWLKRARSDIIHLHLPNPLAMISYLIISPKGKLIISYHNDIVRQKWSDLFLRPLLLKILDKADSIIVTSENLINSSPILKKFRAKCRVIPYGIDVNRFNPTSHILERAEKIKTDIDKPIILFVGRMVYYKGLKYLIRAMRNIDAKLLIIGKGPLEFKLKQLAKKLGVDNKILWLGQISDEELPAYYYSCDLLVLPSCEKSESFGLVLLEAQACGRPVISTDLPTGVTFTNLHQKTGLVVAPKNDKSLTQAINTLLKNPDLRQVYGQNGRDRVRAIFNKEVMAERIFEAYYL